MTKRTAKDGRQIWDVSLSLMELLMALTALVLVLCLIELPATAEEKGGTKADKKAGVSAVDKKVQPSLCKKVASMIKDGTIKKYVPPVENIPDISQYRDLDVDGDGIADKVTVSSGSGESLLEVHLSSGKEYDLDENGSIMLVKLKGKIYALVTYWESGTIGLGRIVGRSFYKLTKNSAEKVCDLKGDK